MNEQRRTHPESYMTVSASGGEKGVKLERYDLIPVEPLAELARVYGYGVEKYRTQDSEYQGPNVANWTKGYEWSKNFGAMLRHIEAARAGEWIDEESGRAHLAHAAWHCFTLMWFYGHRPEFDDRLLGIDAFRAETYETEQGRGCLCGCDEQIEEEIDGQLQLPTEIITSTVTYTDTPTPMAAVWTQNLVREIWDAWMGDYGWTDENDEGDACRD